MLTDMGKTAVTMESRNINDTLKHTEDMDTKIDFDYEVDRLINNLKKFNEYLDAINQALRKE